MRDDHAPVSPARSAGEPGSTRAMRARQKVGMRLRLEGAARHRFSFVRLTSSRNPSASSRTRSRTASMCSCGVLAAVMPMRRHRPATMDRSRHHLDVMGRLATCLASLVETTCCPSCAADDDHELDARGSSAAAAWRSWVARSTVSSTRSSSTRPATHRAPRRGDRRSGVVWMTTPTLDGRSSGSLPGTSATATTASLPQARYALDFGMTRPADDDDGVTRFGKLTCLALDLRDVGTGRVHDRKAAFRSLVDDLRAVP